MDDERNKKILSDAVIKVVKEYRKSSKISQYDLAQTSQLDRGFISLIEIGKRQISLYTLLKLSKGLGIKASELVEKLEEELGNSPFNIEEF
jgi:transcriptional regulator with XRE-family HTH domain